MGRGRLEAFSDAVIAIILTIMVLELKSPHGHEWSSLQPLIPVIFAYVLSFLYVAIYWNNHHHMMHTVQHVDGRILWANLHLMFWLSLIPATTAWMGESHFATAPTILYGAVLLACSLAYMVLTFAIRAEHGPDSQLAKALGSDWKGNASNVLYVTGVIASFFAPLIGVAIYLGTAGLWLIPDRRIARQLQKTEKV
ncbi:MAG: TMEM175 family protein [Caulobacterales bacterium]